MTKSSRHKKIRKQEKNKIKLKLARQFLPKGGNITDATFKTRKIIVKEQLKHAGTTLSATAKLQDLLPHLHHHNTNVKAESLNKLKELLIQSPDLVPLHLATLLERTLSLITDVEEKVHEATVETIQTIISKVSLQQLSPFGALVCAHLTCAMTHINPIIQRSSLLLLHTMLNVHPTIVAVHAKQILPNFLDQVSSKRESSGNVDSKRTLLVQPNEKISSLMWRIQVLRMLHCFLGALKSEISKGNGDNVNQDAALHIHWSEDLNVPLYSALGILQQKEYSNMIVSKSQLQEFSSALTPLLFATWVEASSPHRSDNVTGKPLDASEVIQVLDFILLVMEDILLLATIIEEDDKFDVLPWLGSNFQKDLKQYFIKKFPFSYIRRSSKKLRKSDGVLACTEQNLRLIQICCLLRMKLNHSLTNAFVSFIKGCISESESLSSLEILVGVLKTCMVNPCFRNSNKHWSRILRTCMVEYETLDPQDKKCDIYFHLFMFVLNQKNQLQKSITCMETWIASLPKLLVNRQISQEAINVMLKLCRQNNATFLTALRVTLPDIIESSDYLDVSSTFQVSELDADESLSLLIKIISWLPDQRRIADMHCVDLNHANRDWLCKFVKSKI